MGLYWSDEVVVWKGKLAGMLETWRKVESSFGNDVASTCMFVMSYINSGFVSYFQVIFTFVYCIILTNNTPYGYGYWSVSFLVARFIPYRGSGEVQCACLRLRPLSIFVLYVHRILHLNLQGFSYSILCFWRWLRNSLDHNLMLYLFAIHILCPRSPFPHEMRASS